MPNDKLPAADPNKFENLHKAPAGHPAHQVQQLMMDRLKRAGKEQLDRNDRVKTEDELAKAKVEAIKEFGAASDKFHRSNSASDHKAHQASIEKCRKAGIKDAELAIMTKGVQATVARDNLVKAAEEFAGNPSGADEIAKLHSCRETYSVYGGTEDEIKDIINHGLKSKR